MGLRENKIFCKKMKAILQLMLINKKYCESSHNNNNGCIIYVHI